MENSGFLKLAWATLVVIFLVIIAGSVVRMSGSGMGCPDWPKCFGYYIPPTEHSQVEFAPHKSYTKGQMIIVENDLLKAKTSFTSGEEFNRDNWQVHEKHDYAKFNPTHTWIEYINRLFGALSGAFMLALLIYSLLLSFKKKQGWNITLLCILGVFLLGFQAWLGRTVVDSHLEESKITYHMFGAIALIAVIQLIIRLAKKNYSFALPKSTKRLVWFAFFILLIQLILGTQFRQQVDALLPQSNLTELFATKEFIIHRSFSWVLLLSIVLLLLNVQKQRVWHQSFIFLALLVIVELIFGLILYKAGFPKFAQPVHLVLANIIFAILFWLVLTKQQKKV